MEQPQHGFLERAYAISSLVFARGVGLGNDAMKILTAYVPLNHSSNIDLSRAHDEIKELLLERGISNIDHEESNVS